MTIIIRFKLFVKKLKYFRENWKLMFHLLFSTYHFGVNNKWWSDFDSIFGVPWYKRTPKKIIENYRGMRFRAVACHFISDEIKLILFPKYMLKKWNNWKFWFGGKSGNVSFVE